MEYDPLQEWKRVLLTPFESSCHDHVAQLSARLRALQEAISDLCWITTTDGQLLAGEAAWTRFTGQSVEQAKGKGWLTAVHPGERKLLENMRAQCVRTGHSQEIVSRVRDVEGRYRPLSIRCVPVGSDNVYEVMYLGIALLPGQQDTSKWLRGKGLEHLEAKLIDIAHDAILVCDFADGRILSWNQGATNLYGFSKEEAVGQVAYKLFRSHFPTSRSDFVHALMRDGKLEGEIEQVHRDGHLLMVEARFVLIRSEEGQPLAILEVSRDIRERKRIEQQLQEYVQIAQTAGELGLWTWDVVQNRGVLSLPGTTISPILPDYKPGQLIDYQQLIQIIHPDDRETTAKALREALEQNIDYINEFRVLHPEQGVLWYMAYARPMRDEHGEPVRMVGIVINMTERKRIEQALQEANERLEMIIGSITDTFIFLDKKWRYVYANSTACRYFGKSRDELLGCVYWEATPDDQGIMEQKLRETMAEKKTNKFDMFNERLGRWFSIRMYPAKEGITIFGSDITEHKHMEEEIRKSEAKLRRLVDANISGVLVSDSHGRVIEANDAFLMMIGYTRDELEHGKINWKAMTPPEYDQITWHAVQELRETGVCCPFEKEYITKQGKRVPVLLTGATVESEGDIQKHIMFVVDLTSQKELEKQREHFLHLVSHELRTPLTAINGSLQLAQRRLQRAKQRQASLTVETEEAFSKVEDVLLQSLRQVHVLNRLVDDLVESARITAEKLSLSLHAHNLVEIVQATVEDMRFTTSDREILLEDMPQDVPVLVDAERINQVLANFISNALKYSPHEKPIVVGITLDESNQEARAWVRDQGSGLSPEDQERVWQRYAQGKGVQDREVKSVNLGLGLHLCRLLIQQHHGHVGVESQLGEGSTFWFALPLQTNSS